MKNESRSRTIRTAPGGSLHAVVGMLVQLEKEQRYMERRTQRLRLTMGQAMREAREASGLSLRETARRLSITAPFLSDMERGRRNATVKWVQKLSEVIKHPNDVISDQGAKSKDANALDKET